MRSTSPGEATMFSPCVANITMTVNSNATSVSGSIFGTNSSSYHSSLLARVPTYRVRNPPTNGIPRKIPIAWNTCIGVTLNVWMPATSVSIPSSGGRNSPKNQTYTP